MTIGRMVVIGFILFFVVGMVWHGATHHTETKAVRRCTLCNGQFEPLAERHVGLDAFGTAEPSGSRLAHERSCPNYH